MAKEKIEVLEIKEVKPQTITVHIVGDTDLVLNKMNSVTTRQLVDARENKAKKIEALNVWEEIITSIHWRDGDPTDFSEDGMRDALMNNAPCLTVFGLKKSFGEAVFCIPLVVHSFFQVVFNWCLNLESGVGIVVTNNDVTCESN